MKKLYLVLTFILTISCITACGAPTAEPTSSPTPSASATATPTGTPEPTTTPKEVAVNSVNGLNEQIHINMPIPESGDITVYYKASDAEEYSILDRELMIYGKKEIDCYILGLAKGLYDIKIEQCDGDEAITKLVTDIDVEKQDRSGYAHFKLDEGIGGYNNDGTVKDGAIILYLTNKNKNTLTLDIDGTTYTGIVQILEAASRLDRPLIIRVLDKITTNQWKPRDAGKRYTDEETHDENFLTNSFTAFGDNIVGLTVDIHDGKEGIIHRYVTTVDDIQFVRDIEGNVETREEDGRSFYLDYYKISNINVRDASNITIEGVGTNAIFYQFGINFIYCNSIEVRNITFSKYTEDAIDFFGYDQITEYGRYWVHNNTFNLGYNAWTLPGMDLPSDEAIVMADIHNATISYNYFNETFKAIMLGSVSNDTQLNITIHHNYFYKVTQRSPLSLETNLHNYNNFFNMCRYTTSPRGDTYLFSEANFYFTLVHYYASEAEGAQLGTVKSYNDFYSDYDNINSLDDIYIVTDREAYVENTCMPDKITDYSRFDTDPNLFYYDAENKCSDVELMHDVKNITSFVQTYSGAGVYKRLELSK